MSFKTKSLFYFVKNIKGELGAYAMKHVAAGAHLATPRLFESAKRRDDTADYCLNCSFLPSASIRYSFLQLSGQGRTVWGNSDWPNEYC